MSRIQFLPSGVHIEASPGTGLADACRLAGFRLPAPCGEKGLCGKCRVMLLAGDIPIDARQRACLPPKMLEAGWRAACVAECAGDLTLADPETHREGVVLTDFMAREARGASAVWEHTVELSPPSAADQRDDLTRLIEAVRSAAAANEAETPRLDPDLLARLPEVLRQNDFRCRVAGLERDIVAVSGLPRENEPGRRLGLAVDVGTTTLAAALCDLDDGRVLAVASRDNPQSVRGDDVISRIDYASRGERELAEMRSIIMAAIEDLAETACREAGVEERPFFVMTAGNTVMTHLLLGISPRAMALSPFIPVFRGPMSLCASRLGWGGEHPPRLLTVPNLSAYVGGDIVAGMLAHDLFRLDGNALFLDVGTNGEIALSVKGVVYACATAAGPAFEGARIRQGTRAVPGAVSRVAVNESGDLVVGTVDSLKPARGICGTGLLDAVAALLTLGIVDEGGRLLDAEEARETGARAGAEALERIHEDGEGMAIWLEKPDGHGGSGVALTQRDIREFQLAKGAIAAGIRVLLSVAGIAAEEVHHVLLAGGFGNYLDPASALATGLLPAGMAHKTVRSVGNASLAGARLCLLSGEERAEALRISRSTAYIELSGRDDFQQAFAEEMLFPAGDAPGL